MRLSKNPRTCADLLQPIEETLGTNYMLWPDGGFTNGSLDTPVRGVLLTWMINVAALSEAVRRSCNVVVCHEGIFYSEKTEQPPYRWLTPIPATLGPSRHPNGKRQRLIQQHHLTIFQCHYGLDRFGHEQAFAEALGLRAKHHDHGWESVYELPRPVPLADLARDVKRRLRIQGTVRVVGDLKKKVRRVANLWGGLGLKNNLYWVHQDILNGADVGICGEMDEFFMHYCTEAGFPVIETSHQLSEEVGMGYYAKHLKARYPDLRVVNFQQGRPYRTI